jgi:hypothetical protein
MSSLLSDLDLMGSWADAVEEAVEKSMKQDFANLDSELAMLAENSRDGINALLKTVCSY